MSLTQRVLAAIGATTRHIHHSRSSQWLRHYDRHGSGALDRRILRRRGMGQAARRRPQAVRARMEKRVAAPWMTGRIGLN